MGKSDRLMAQPMARNTSPFVSFIFVSTYIQPLVECDQICDYPRLETQESLDNEDNELPVTAHTNSTILAHSLAAADMSTV